MINLTTHDITNSPPEQSKACSHFKYSGIIFHYARTVGHFKNTEVFIFGDALGFSIVWSIWCPLVPFLAKSINI